MNPKLTLTALASVAVLSGCYYVPYGYGYPGYPGYPAYPAVGTAYTQQEVPVGTQGTSSSATTTGDQYTVAQPPVAYSSYPAYPAIRTTRPIPMRIPMPAILTTDTDMAIRRFRSASATGAVVAAAGAGTADGMAADGTAAAVAGTAVADTATEKRFHPRSLFALNVALWRRVYRPCNVFSQSD